MGIRRFWYFDFLYSLKSDEIPSVDTDNNKEKKPHDKMQTLG
jgi:hypothetical protein